MNYKLHDNGWTVLINDFDVKSASQADADQIAKLVSSNIAVVLQGDCVEDLTPEDQVRFCSMIGHLEEYESDTAWGRAISLGPDTVGKKVQRVTGAKNTEGHPGLFGHDEELDWHNNTPWDPKRKPAVWLKSISGAEGSRTSWTNTKLAFEDLQKEDPAFIEYLEEQKFRVVCGWRAEGGHTTMYNYWANFGEMANEIRNDESAMPLIFVNESGNKGFFLPYLQSFAFHGLSREESLPIMERIWNYTHQDKYVYHHDWKPGGKEVVIAEQWLSVHKRNAFDKMETRFMQRIALDYTNTSWWPENKSRFTKQIIASLRENIKQRNLLTQLI